jgi:electron transfer flavoprotein alpha subunit
MRLAVVPVREGELSAGGAEAVAEAGGVSLLAGDGTVAAAAGLAGLVTEPVTTWEVSSFAPGGWAAALVPVVRSYDVVIVPNSPDGRDLAPRLADALGRTYWAGAVEVGASSVTCARWGSRVLEVHPIDGPIVATLQPGVRGQPVLRDGAADAVPVKIEPLALDIPSGVADVEVLEVLPPDVTTMDLAEARRIMAGGAGVGGPPEFALLARVAEALGASVGGTRVVTDAGLLSHDRQIGTTGVVVHPRVYVAVGISGAVQHTNGLGDPDHIISVNTDAHCPMMAMADLAVVTDAASLLRQLGSRLGVDDG